VSAAQFPTVTGSNLLRQKIALPGDFQGEVNVACIAFQQWHQGLVDTWVPWLRQLEDLYPDFRFYELPVIYRMNILVQTFINEGMRAGIPNPKTREKTITLYTDKEVFRRALDLPSEETIWLVLVDRRGDVRFRLDGAFSNEKGEALKQAVASFFNQPQLAGEEIG
jgi:hypothetical protein